MYLFLFDVDGTLIHSGGAGKKALEEVFYELYEVENAMEGIKPDGKTDIEIIKEILMKKTGIKDPDESIINIIVNEYLSRLEKTINNPDYRVVEGAKEFVQKIHYSKRNLQGLATGNLEMGAKIKLKPSGLLKYFRFGGFGSDSQDRVEILKIAVERAQKFAEEEIERVYVVGDTPRDIKAAKEAGFLSVAVATGNYSYNELLKHNPDFLFTSLKDPDAVKLLLDWDLYV